MPGPLVLDLVAALVQGGAPPRAALGSVGEALRAAGDPRGSGLLLGSELLGSELLGSERRGFEARGFEARGFEARGLEARGSAGPGRPAEPVDADRLVTVLRETLWLSVRSGLPPTMLIRRCATEERRRQATAQVRAVRRLEVLLVLPAGLCLLPAFVVLGVVPVVLDLILG